MRLLAVCLCALLVAPAALAAPLPTDAEKKTESPAEKIRRQLDETIANLDITEQPLHLAITQFREQTKINFVLDRFAIAQIGIDPESAPVNLKLKDVKRRTALRTMLSQYNLSYVILGETVVITTDDMAVHRQMKQRVNVDFDRKQLGDALKQLGRETATNLLVDGRVGKESLAPVTIQLEDVPLETAVRLMCESAGLKPVRVGNVLYVTSKAHAAELRSDPDLATPAQPGQPVVQDIINMPGGGGVMAMPLFRQGVPAVPAAPAAGATPVIEGPGTPDKPPPDKPSEKPPEKPAEEKKPVEEKKPPEEKKEEKKPDK